MSNEFLGTLVPGVGRGAKFIAMDVYSNIFETALGQPPFLGTFNIKIPEEFRARVDNWFSNGKVHDNLKTNGNPTGGIIINDFQLKIKGETIPVVGVRPILTSHDNSIVEFVASIGLRDKFSLNDSDKVTVIFG